MTGPARILGLDPGTRVVGYGLIEVSGSRIACLEAGALSAPRDAPLERRLARLASQVRELLRRHRPGSVAVEDLFVRRDPKAALSVGHARGAILAVLGEADLAVASYAPASIKRAVAGNGRAGKDQVARMVAAILGLGRPPEPADATDALAAAIAHAFATRVQGLGGK